MLGGGRWRGEGGAGRGGMSGADEGRKAERRGAIGKHTHRRTDPLVAILEVTALVYSKKLITSGVWTWMFPQNYG